METGAEARGMRVLSIRTDADKEGFLGRNCVVLGHVFQEKLQGAGDDLPGEVFVADFLVHGKALGEAHPEQVRVHRHEGDLLAQGDEFLAVVLEHVAVDAGELVDVQAGLFLLTFLHDGVQDVQRVEQEMRVHLVLEGHVAVLGQVPALALSTQLAPDVHGVLHQVREAEEGHLHQEGDDDVPGKRGRVQREGPVEGEAEGMQQGAQDGDQADEQGRADGGDVQAVVLVVPGPDEEERADEHRQDH